MNDAAGPCQHGLNSSLLARYDPAERQAIIVHKYFLGIELDSDPGLMVAIESWERYHAASWRRQRHLEQCRLQMEQIEKYRQEISCQRGQEIGWEAAAREWIRSFASQWRLGRPDCA